MKVAAAVSLFMCAAAHAQFTFEAPTYTGSAAGTTIAGQDMWFTPQPPVSANASVDSLVYTYAGNTLGIAANPFGGAQFVGGTFTTAASRAQRPIDFSAGGTWTTTFDIACLFSGTLPSANNLGSFSLQNPTTAPRTWQTLYNWTDNNTATTWNCAFLPFDSAGAQAAQPGVLPDPAFGSLLANHWYRVGVTFSFDTNQITSTSIRDLSTTTTTTVSPSGWYLTGGQTPTLPLPTDVRFFASGAVGNTVAFDNFSATHITVPPGACCAQDGTCTVVLPSACAAPSLFQTGTTACGAGNTCPNATSACCNNSSGACSYVQGGTCAAGSTRTGSACSPSPCVITGVCCDQATAVCSPIFGGTCPLGSSAGTGLSCGANSCVIGACCAGCRGCSRTVASNCSGGVYMGDGTTCETVCPGEGYSVATGPGVFVAGTASTGNACDDCSTLVALPFPVSFYGSTYNSVNADSNGFLDFTNAYAVNSGFYSNDCLPAARGTTDAATTSFGPAIMALWDDLRTDALTGAGIFTATSGVAPNRSFAVEWRAYPFGQTPTAPTLDFEVVFYEGRSYFDMIYGTPFTDTCSATVGIEQIGSLVSPATQYACNISGVTPCTGQINAPFSLRYNCGTTVGACCSAANACSTSNSANCPSGSTFRGAGTSCSPNPCVQTGVCCRGATCSTTVSQANCTAPAGTHAGAAFVSTASACNAAGNRTTPCCEANYNKAGGISVQDIFDFLADWFGGSIYADIHNNGAGAPTVQSIFDFLAAWFGGGCT